MKTIRFYMILCIVGFLPLLLQAKNKWNTPDKGYFKYQKDVDLTVSDFSKSMSTVYFHGKLFNFIYYEESSLSIKIIIRKLTLSADKTRWLMEKQDNIENLSNLSYKDFQPTPVVFHDSLYLFVDNFNMMYSKYNEKNDSWSSLKTPNVDLLLDIGSAVVVDDKLCFITSGECMAPIQISWTKDMVNWNKISTEIKNGIDYTHYWVERLPTGIIDGTDYYYKHISAISKSWIDNKGKVNSKIMLAYLGDYGSSAKVAEFAFDDNDKLNLISNVTIADELTYSSITIVDGKVKGDPATGNCTQVFLKKSEIEKNWYCRYRLLRYQKEEGGSWTKQENNLVPQNYLWADKNLNINAVNFPTADGKQLMCLIYRGYDDWDHPMNIAWAENTQPVVSSVQSKLLSNPVVGQKGSSDSNNPGENIPMVRNWPNPVSTTTTIQYKVVNENPEIGIEFQRYTTLSVYDNRGTLVKTLVNELKMPGTYEVKWDASSLPAGIYLCKLLNGNNSAVCKMVVNK